MPPVIAGNNNSRWLIFAAIVVAIAIAVLFAFNPSQHGFYPRCFFKLSTGLDCAGCGGLRATHQLLNGNPGAAFHLNPLLFFALPVMAILFLNAAAENTGRRQVFSRWTIRVLLWSLLVISVVFTVWRNLPR